MTFTVGPNEKINERPVREGGVGVAALVVGVVVARVVVVAAAAAVFGQLLQLLPYFALHVFLLSQLTRHFYAAQKKIAPAAPGRRKSMR